MRILIAPLLIFLPLFAVAHEPNDNYDRVHLSASAQTRIENDTVIATLYAQEEGSDSVQLANMVNERINEAIGIVKQHDSIKLQTSSYSTSPVYHKNKITGWRVSQSIRLESQDMTLMSEILGQLQQSLALQGVNFAVSPDLKNSTDDKLIAEALEVFGQRAKMITTQLGRKNYKIVDVKISTSANQYVRRSYEAAPASLVAAPAIEGGEQAIQVSINGEIELE